jgi:hypothetical protein
MIVEILVWHSLLIRRDETAFGNPQRVPQATPRALLNYRNSPIFNIQRFGALRAICQTEESEGTQMKSFMSVTLLVEVAFLSFLLALWITWWGLRGLFRLLPATNRSVAPVRFVANRRAEHKIRRAA